MAEEPARTRSTASVIAFVIAVISLLLSPVPIINNVAFFMAIIAIIFAIVGRGATKKKDLRGKKTAVIAIIISLLACGVVLASQAFYGNEIDKVGEGVQKSLDDSSGKNTDNILGKEVTVDIGQFSVTTDQYGINTTELPIKVTNKNTQQTSYSIKIEAVDANGSRLADDSIYPDKLGSGQSQDFKAFQYVESGKVEALKTAKFKVSSVSKY